MLRSWVLLLFKYCFAIFLLVLLVQSGRLSFVGLMIDKWNYGWVAVAAGLSFLQIALAAWRWKLLLKLVDIRINYWRALSVTWLSVFCGSFLAGALGGDLVRGVFSAKEFSKRGAAAVSVILLDRMMGLMAMVLLAFLAAPFAPGAVVVAMSGRLQLLILSGLAIAAVSLAVVMLVGGLRRRAHSYIRRALGVVQRPGSIRSLFLVGLWALITQAGLVCLLFALMQAAPLPDELRVGGLDLAWMTPLMVIASALPLTPAGIGVGQTVLGYLFEASGLSTAQAGGVLATSFQIVGFAVSLGGLLFLVHPHFSHRPHHEPKQ